MNGRRWLLALALLGWVPLAAATGGNAAGSSGSLTLNTSLSVDAADDHDYQLGGQVGVSDSTFLNFLSEYTSSPASSTDLVTHTDSLGVEQALGRHAGFGLRYESWGKSNDLVSDAFYGSVYWQTRDWQLTASPGTRRITLYTRSGKIANLLNLPNSIDIRDNPLGLRVDYSGVENWLFEVSTTRHHYSRDPSVLGRRIALLFFTGSALTLSQGFLSHSSTARVERDFDLTSLAMDYEIDRSALDGTYSYTTDIDFTTPVSNSFDIEITTGVTHSVKFPETGFITFNLVYYH
ncbi:MAG: hypothetical protein KGJ56_01725 [Gammaproteobacteria bacterium]|nr:hypothetical protein [Gammaproteobacteria bacterium]